MQVSISEARTRPVDAALELSNNCKRAVPGAAEVG